MMCVCYAQLSAIYFFLFPLFPFPLHTRAVWVPSTWEWNMTLWLLFQFRTVAVSCTVSHLICNINMTPLDLQACRGYMYRHIMNLLHVLCFYTNMWSIFKGFSCIYSDLWSIRVNYSISWFKKSHHQLLVWIIYCWCYIYSVSPS